MLPTTLASSLLRRVSRASTRQLCLSTRRTSLNLQEYQSKRILQEGGCHIQPFFIVADAEEELKEVYREYVVKAQVLAGGRGKGHLHGESAGKGKGGIVLTPSQDEAKSAIRRMIGKRLVTNQTTSDGLLVKKCMVADSYPIVKSFYLAFVLDLEHACPVVISCQEGGVDIEEVAERDPHLIHRQLVDIHNGLGATKAREIAEFLGFSNKAINVATEEIRRLYKIFIERDAVLLEINPFAEIHDGTVCCIDTKMSLDESARFRQKEFFDKFESEREQNEELNVIELVAKQHHLNYVGLEGDIACLVNGAGLAMATMDMISQCGGRAANFLDVGGGVTQQQVHDAFHLITSDQRVRAMWINVFGGIVDCETIAKGILAALPGMVRKFPLVVRLQGTNSTSAMALLKSASSSVGHAMHTEADFARAAEKAVCLANESKSKTQK